MQRCTVVTGIPGLRGNSIKMTEAIKMQGMTFTRDHSYRAYQLINGKITLQDAARQCVAYPGFPTLKSYKAFLLG